MTILQRDLHLNDLIDRVEGIERDLRQFSDYAFVMQDLGQIPYEPDWKSLSGWIVTGSTLQDENGYIKLDPTVPRIQIYPSGYIESSNFISGSAGFQINGGTAEFNDVTVRGTIYATAGEIGGWTIAASSISKNDATLHSDGYLVLGTSNDIVRIDAADATYRLWVGNATAASAPFRVSKAGAITSSSGTIGGWTIAGGSLTGGDAQLHSVGWLRLGAYNDIVRVDASDATYRLWAGHALAASAPFRVSKSGEVWATNGHFTGEIDANSGHLGSLDVDGLITVGTGTPYIEIDGPNKRIETSNFAAGTTGFRIEGDGDAEFNNLDVRGAIHCAVFIKDLISAHAGSLIVTKSAGKLAEDCLIDTDNLVVEHPPGDGTAWLFDTGDIIRLKEEHATGVYQTWITVTQTATVNEYTYTKNDGNTTTYHKGTTAVDYGASGDGGVLMTADMSNAPYLNVFTHAGAPWTTTTGHARLGNMNGILDFTSDTYGVAAGDDLSLAISAVSGFSIDSSSGMRLFNTNFVIYDSGDLSLAINSGGIRLTDLTTTGIGSATIWWADYSANVSAEMYADVDVLDVVDFVIETDPQGDYNYQSYIKLIASQGGGAQTIQLGPGGVLMSLVDSDVMMDVGAGALVIDQGTADTVAFEMRSDDVTHGMTDYVDTNTYLSIQKMNSNAGGAKLRGWKDADGLGGYAFIAEGFIGEAADKTKSTVGVGVICLQAGIKSGNGVTSVGTDGNLVTIRNYGTTCFIFDVEGSAHADVEWTTFDEHDDVALLSALEHHVINDSDPIKAEFGQFLEYNKDTLERMNLAHFEEDRPSHAMVNFTRLSMLLTGAVKQLNERLDRYERALVGLGVDVKLLAAEN